MELFNEEDDGDTPRKKYIPIGRLYSSTSPFLPLEKKASSVMSKKIKARKTTAEGEGVEDMGEGEALEPGTEGPGEKPLIVYRRRPRDRQASAFVDKPSAQTEIGLGSDGSAEPCDVKVDMGGVGVGEKRKRTPSDGSNGEGRKCIRGRGDQKEESCGPGKTRKWVELDVEGADPLAFVGLSCKVFWPMDGCWYVGSITGHSPDTQQHRVEYKDGDVENLTLSNERLKFHVSLDEMQHLNLKHSDPSLEKKVSNYDEMLALALNYDDGQDFEPGDIVWAKHSGHSMWPALVMGEERVLKPHREKAISVQFFGARDCARINLKQVRPFFRGLLSSFHLKCKQRRFRRSLKEAKTYLSQQKFPNGMMLQSRKGDKDEVFPSITCRNEGWSNSKNDPCDDDGRPRVPKQNGVCPLEIGDLCVISLGKIVSDSDYFHNKHFIWPEGYTASRRFMSVTNPGVMSFYIMEVLRNPKARAKPLFRVTLENGEKIEGSNPTSCWEQIYCRIRRNISNGFASVEECELQRSGSYMFGFSNSKISQLIQDLPNSRCSKQLECHFDSLPGYRAVYIEWKDLDRCNVCHMDEEYEDNLFLQCDKCRMMVHARCYGESRPRDGSIWLCNLCQPGAPKPPPRCCLCPVSGGAIKPTTDGRWAHLTCSMWIPETCLLDIKKMEPVDGISRINKDRWKLLCSICGVPYGACIQCSNLMCRVAYHPLCARAAGLCVELEDEDRLQLMSFDEGDDQCIRLLSYCRKHRQPANEHSPDPEQCLQTNLLCSDYTPPANPSGCARCEPYNFFGRRGQKEPQVLAAASVKRLYVESRPYLISGYRQNGVGCDLPCSQQSLSPSGSCSCESPLENLEAICSVAEKYKYMKATFRKRLTFGKSTIHGVGVFATVAHKAGDMVIEYVGELVRPPIADIREHRIYNSLVGAGTYMFRIDNEHVVDATRAGSIAHLINHSCEPNCYSRVITVGGDEHIIIFAKRDIKKWEELTYDYRFFSIDERLACSCGFPRCRGVVNDTEAEEQVAQLWVSRHDLIDWTGE